MGSSLSERQFESLLEAVNALLPEEPGSCADYPVPFSLETRSSSSLTRFLLRLGTSEALEFRRVVLQQELHRGRSFAPEVVQWLSELPEAKTLDNRPTGLRSSPAVLSDKSVHLSRTEAIRSDVFEAKTDKSLFWENVRVADRLRGQTVSTGASRVDLRVPLGSIPGIEGNSRLNYVLHDWQPAAGVRAPPGLWPTEEPQISLVADAQSLRKLPGLPVAPFELWSAGEDAGAGSGAVAAMYLAGRSRDFAIDASCGGTPGVFSLEHGAGDEELESAAAGIGTGARVPVTNVSVVNTRVTRLSPVLSRVDLGRLKKLDLRGNPHLSTQELQTVFQQSKTVQLETFVYNDVDGQKHGLYRTLRELGTCVRLKRLELRNVDLGRWSDEGSLVLGLVLMDLPNLQRLDISGNFLRKSDLHVVGESLVRMACVCELIIDNNCGELGGVESLCARLGEIKQLRLLSLRNSQVDDFACFCLYDTFCRSAVRAIDVSSNPAIGLFGVRCLLLVYLLNANMQSLGIRCAADSETAAQDGTLPDLVDLSATYRLDLGARPFNQALVRKLLKRWAAGASAAPLEETFVDCRLDNKVFCKFVKEEDQWVVPESGILTFTFVQRGGPEGGLRRRLDPETAFPKLLQAWQDAQNLQPVLVEALSRDFELSGDQLVHLVGRTTEAKVKTHLLERFIDKVYTADQPTSGHASVFQVFPVWAKLLKRGTDQKKGVAMHKAHKRSGLSLNYYGFAQDNPTGHYVLNLALPGDQMVAEQLLLSSRFEMDCLKREKRPDISQTGNFQCIRNETFDGKRFAITQDWLYNLPSRGVLELDYASLRRKSAGGTLAPEAFAAVVQLLKKCKTDFGVAPCLALLRRASVRMQHLTCERAAVLISQLGETSNEIMREVFVTVFARIADYANIREHFFRAKLGLPAIFNAGDLAILEHRLGKLAFFNPLKVDNFRFVADLSDHQGRLIAVIMMTLLTKEKNNRLINNTINGVACPEVPTDWKALQVPFSGTWTATYLSDDTGALQSLRTALGEKYCGYSPTPDH